MNRGITLRDLASPAFVGVNESDTLLGTVRLLADEDESSAVVVRGTEPVGSVTAAAVLGLVADGVDLAATTVGESMTDPPPVLAAGEGVDAAAAAFANGARQVLVADGDELLGTVAPRDLIAAGGTYGRGTDADADAVAAPRRDADEASGAGIRESADAGTAAATSLSQGICEGCGAFARGLAAVDGQLICPDCRGV